MISNLLDGAKGLRLNAAVGYIVLFVFWLLVRGRSLDAGGRSGELWEDLTDALGGLGAGSTAALASFAAVMLGSLVTPRIKRIVETILGWISPSLLKDWEGYVDEARAEYEQAGERQVRSEGALSFQDRQSIYFKLSGSGVVELARSDYQERVRQRSAFDFRLIVGVLWIVPAVLMVIQTRSVWWLLGLVPSIVVLLDARQMRRRIKRWRWERADEEESRELDRKKSLANNGVGNIERWLDPGGDKHPIGMDPDVADFKELDRLLDELDAGAVEYPDTWRQILDRGRAKLDQ